MPRDRRRAGHDLDRGSVTPLVIGMVVCLLLLGAGVTAATSAFLARQRLQNACDGAAAAAADAAAAGYYTHGDTPVGDEVASKAANDYLDLRHPQIDAVAHATADSVRVACTAESDITMGSLFGVPTLSQTVQAVGRTTL